jgi:hypothetical protein
MAAATRRRPDASASLSRPEVKRRRARNALTLDNDGDANTCRACGRRRPST